MPISKNQSLLLAHPHHLQVSLQARLDTSAGETFLIMANNIVSSFFNQNYLARNAHDLPRLQALFPQIFFSARSLQIGLIGRVAPTLLEMIIALSIIGALFGPVIIILFFILILLFIGFSFFFSKQTDEAGREFQDSFTHVNAQIGEALLLHDQIQSFGGTKKTLDEISTSLAALHFGQINLSRAYRNFSFMQSITIYGFSYLILAIVIAEIIRGETSIAALTVLSTYIFQFAAPLNTIGFYLRGAVQSLMVIQDIFQEIEINPFSSSQPRPGFHSDSAIKLTMKNIRFVADPADNAPQELPF